MWNRVPTEVRERAIRRVQEHREEPFGVGCHEMEGVQDRLRSAVKPAGEGPAPARARA